jgi:hypothetical protein
LSVPADRLANGLGGKPFAITHDLVDHPLLTLEAIAELADYLPADTNVEHNLGDVPEVLPDGDAPRLELTPGEIVRTIDSNRCWMVLKWIEEHPAYRELLEHTLNDVTAAVEANDGPIRKREGFIFISAPNSVTPTHIDPEYNFLLQIRGRKEMVVAEYTDPEIENQEIERFYGGGHRNLNALPDAAQTFVLEPGNGLFVPIHAPHVVRNGPDPSISLSVTWSTEGSHRMAAVYAFNARLRTLRIAPHPPGRRPGVDRAKAGGWMAAASALRQVRRLRDGSAA